MAAAAGQSGWAEGRRAATGERLAARDAEPLHFSHPSVPSISRPPHTPHTLSAREPGELAA